MGVETLVPFVLERLVGAAAVGAQIVFMID
jgi:hypothetical protein